jgi:hypothetical protein
MDRQPATVSSQQRLAAEFEVLCSVAVAALTAHVNAYGSCATCGCPWPCEPVVLAEHNLAAL